MDFGVWTTSGRDPVRRKRLAIGYVVGALVSAGLVGLVPERRKDVAQLGLKSIVAGTLASFMTACIAGMLA